MPMRRCCIILCLFLLTTSVSFAQTRKEFEVASIRPVGDQPPNQVTAGLHIDGSQVRITSLSLKDYISIAYRMRLNQISGPEWLGSVRFDLAAKLPDGASQDDVMGMLQVLLAERFQIKMHREMKEFSIYALGVAKTGLKLTPTVPEAEIKSADRRPVNVAAGGSGAGVAINFGQGSYLSLGEKSLEIKRLDMPTIADMLTRFLDRPVVDMTNLKGGYDLDLAITPEDRLVMMIRAAVTAGVVLPPQALALIEGASADSLSEGMKKVGLTLEAQKAPLEVLVIDQIQKTPTEN
jgi:uncharacterized protein (TIGR03435 family)